MNSFILDPILRHALEEDIGTGDVTTLATIALGTQASAELVAKEDFVLAGIDVAQRVFQLLSAETAFEKSTCEGVKIPEQEYFDNGILMIAMVKAGVELAFEAMVKAGIIDESAYYESLHETPLIANTIARKKLYEMNSVISDTAEYGCYLFDHACKPLLTDFMKTVSTDLIGKKFTDSNDVDNQELIRVNAIIRSHPVEKVGAKLRASMTAMKVIKSA